MGRIRNLIENQKNEIIQIMFKYSGTIIVFAVMCILWIINVYAEFEGDGFEKIIAFLMLLTEGCFLFESCMKDRRQTNITKLICGYVIFAIIAAAVTITAFSDLSEEAEDFVAKFTVFYSAFIFTAAFYVLIKNSSIDFFKYATNCFFNIIKVFGVFLIINIGIFLIIGLIDILLLEVDWKIMEVLEFILLGGLYFPYLLIAVTDNNFVRDELTNKLLKFALMPMVIIATIVIYLYIIKLFATGELPDNEIFEMCEWLFTGSVIITSMFYAYINDDTEPGRYYKLVKYYKYFLFPLVLLEGYAIGTRISMYGVTDARYAAVMFIILQLIYIFWEFIVGLYNKIRGRERTGYGEKYEGLLLVILAFTGIALLIPGINSAAVSFNSQKKRMEKAIAAGEEKEIYGAYRYLKYTVKGEEYLDENYTSADIEGFEEIDPYYYDDTNYRYIRWGTTNKDINIAGYNKLNTLDYDNYENEYRLEDLKSYSLEVYADGERREYNVNLYDIINLIIVRDDNLTLDMLEEPFEIIVDGNKKLELYSISFKFYDDNKVGNISLTGYVMEK